MFIPIGDTPNPRNYTPYVNYVLIGLNVAVYLIISLPLSYQAADPADPNLHEYIRLIAPDLPAWVSLYDVLREIRAYDLFTFVHGYKPGAPEIADLFFCAFLHGSFLHLAGNMLFLWIFGDNVEHRLGRIGYLLTYLATGVVATLTFATFAGDSMTPLVGASGAISGVLGVYFLLFKRNRVKVFILLFPFFMNVILLPARWVLGFYIVIDNLLPLLLGSQSNVAYGAHLGGFLAGLIVAFGGEALSWRWPFSDRHRQLGRKARAVGGLDTLRQAMQTDKRGEALQSVSKLGRVDLARLAPEECVVLSGWLEEAGHSVAATKVLRRCIAAHPTHVDLARAYLALGAMRLKQGQPTAAYQHLLAVFDHDPAPEIAARARLALAEIDAYKRKK